MTNQEIFDLIARFETGSLHSMKLTRGDFSLELTKGGAPAPCPTPAAVPVVSPPVEQAPIIDAPLVGTYYAAPSPDAAPFVAVGDRVKEGQTVCVIEAMKMISEIPAPCDCIITEILKENGSLATFHEPLFRYTPC